MGAKQGLAGGRRGLGTSRGSRRLMVGWGLSWAAWVGVEVSAEVSAEVREGAGSTLGRARGPLTLSASYLSARLSPPQGRPSSYLSDDALSLALSSRLWAQGRRSVGVGVGAQVWREALQLTPSPLELRPMTPVEGEAQSAYPTLNRPAQVTRDEVTSGLGVITLSGELRARGALWPSLTLHLGALWLPLRGEAQAAQGAHLWASSALGGQLSGWLSGRLSWREEGRLLSPWLYGRWGGVSVGTELMEERSAVSLRGDELALGLNMGRASLSLSRLQRGERHGYGAGLTLPLSAPLYLCSSAWLSPEGEGERAFTIGLRWTGEERLMELPPPSGGAAPSGPSAPSGPPLGSPNRSGAPLSPLSPRSPGGTSTPNSGPVTPL